MTTLAQALKQAVAEMRHGEQAPLEAEVLLAHVLGKPRSHLHAWPDAELGPHRASRFAQLVRQRAAGEPIAYLTGRREFWSLEFEVSRATLIPRPETELLVEQALTLLPGDRELLVAELGTGSGAVAVALARERQRWRICASDRSAAALEIARRNAARLGAHNLAFLIGDWTEAFAERSLDAIISNPPYVAEQDPHLARGDLRFEPRSALAAGPSGLDALTRLIKDATRVLKADGRLFLEHAPEQTQALHNIMTDMGLDSLVTVRDLAGLERVTQAHKAA